MSRQVNDIPRLSMVVAVYNVAPYIDVFFDSLIGQQGGVGQLEVIVVNDGSTDGSGAIAEAWAARYPQLIRYVAQSNQGVAQARNAGLALATGDWVSFPDPDDFLSPDFLQQMRAAILRPRLRKLLAVTARFVFYDEAADSQRDTHPLRKQFGPRDKTCNSTELGNMLLIHTTCTFIRREDITRYKITFDPGIRPSFEDAHFMLRVLINCPGRSVVFLAKPTTYYYRKRTAANSLVDSVVTDPNWYAPHLDKAYLSLLQEAVARRGHVPRFVQNSVLFSLLAKLRHLTGPHYDDTRLSTAEKADFVAKLRQVMRYVQPNTLRRTKIPLMTSLHRQALKAWLESQSAKDPTLSLYPGPSGSDQYDLRWIVEGMDTVRVRVELNRTAIPTATRQVTEISLFNRPYAQSVCQPIIMKAGQTLRVFVDDKPQLIRIKGQIFGFRATHQQLRKAFADTKQVKRSLPVRVALRLSLFFFR